MDNLTTVANTSNSPPSQRPAYRSRDLHDLEAIAASGRPLTVTDRMVLAERLREIESGLRPFPGRDRDMLANAIVDMLRGFRAEHNDPSGVVATIMAYVEAVRGMPSWAVQMAAKALITSRDPNGQPRRFAPSIAEFFAAVDGEVQPLRDELHDIRRYLDNAEAAERKALETRANPSDVIARLEADLGPNFGLGVEEDEATKQAKSRASERLRAANAELRRREFARAGLDVPTDPLAPSPALLATVTEKEKA